MSLVEFIAIIVRSVNKNDNIELNIYIYGKNTSRNTDN